MNKYLMLVLLTGKLFGAAALLPNTGAYEFNRSGAVNKKYALGTSLVNATQFGTRGVWKFTDSGGAVNTTIPLKDSEGNNVTFPAGAVITSCFLDVPTQIKSASSTAKLAFSVSGAGDLKASVAISTLNAAAISSGKPIACIQDGTATNMIKLTSEGQLSMAVGIEAVTQGQVDVWVQYILSGSN